MPTLAALPEIVVVGTSAGGIEALDSLLPALPADLAVPVVVVVHLPDDAPSMLAELFAARCRVPLRQAVDKEPVAPGVVYFAPPGYHLQIEDERTFSLSVDEPVNFARPSIDVLFETAAHVYRANTLGIVLTGANADGARGLAQIRLAGGKGWVQLPAEAAASAMPMAALERAGADAVLSLDEIRARWARLRLSDVTI